MWFKNIQIFRLSRSWAITATALNEALQKQSFAQCASSESEASGWSSPCGDDRLVFEANKQWLLKLTTEKKLLPSSVVNQLAKEKAAELEEQQGFAPGRKALKELKERAHEELLPKAFSVRRDTSVWIDPVNHWVVVDSATPSKADEVIKLLLKCVDIPLESFRVKLSPQSAMTNWLTGDEAPKGFTIDQDTELQAHTQDKASVRYARHSLDQDDVKKHIASGKECIKMAMTWNDKISFVLTSNSILKRIKPLTVLDEPKDAISSRNEDERFEADFVLMTGELNELLGDVQFALGGILESA
jgi:recombination associated protein RdgC